MCSGAACAPEGKRMEGEGEKKMLCRSGSPERPKADRPAPDSVEPTHQSVHHHHGSGLALPFLATPPGWSLPFRSCEFPSCFCHLCAPCVVVVTAVVVVPPNLKPSPAASLTSISLCDCGETIDYWLWPISQHWHNYSFNSSVYFF
ncbi:hypothetical protein M431DRAFT_237413 [Trichoderma harzianum CBS 226.95]|uniref:Uncharacterized protein n=1 Tax=Trichoderma harzianum CBS 226.95 TaxID=983964 RepID=A0A2T4A2B9_TRIHA|nr:hypothetical protein M431DRAFT_237413 [Trichoderma harzianum CBS 226.95]PTB51210.1 hypothetical protein M431DRAFT_237413 [Trichoderma harzianum CBS 226.95]